MSFVDSMINEQRIIVVLTLTVPGSINVRSLAGISVQSTTVLPYRTRSNRYLKYFNKIFVHFVRQYHNMKTTLFNIMIKFNEQC